jgi:periplasmic protein CpxP/Spy
MKRIFVLFAFLMTGVIAQAQTAQPATVSPVQERAHAHAVRLDKILTLTPEQMTQVEAITLAKLNAIDAVNADASKTQEQKDQEIADIRAQKETEILALLTPEQVTKYNEMKQQKLDRKETSGQE